MDEPTTEKKKGKLPKMKMSKNGLMVLVLLAAVGFSGWLYMENQKAKKEIDRLSNPQEAAKAETEALVKKVGELYELPTDETPTVATVTDAGKLKEQPFFKNAQNGDKVLIYTKARVALLYRPSTHKLIQVAPVNIGENQKK